MLMTSPISQSSSDRAFGPCVQIPRQRISPMKRVLGTALIACLPLIFAHASSALALDRYVATTGSDTGNTCAVMLSPCMTIEHAVMQSMAGDTIHVAAGTYNEQVTVDKTLTFDGAQVGNDARMRSGPESIVTDSEGPFLIEADNVVIDGFTVEGATSDPTTDSAASGSGIWDNPSFSGTHGGYLIQNNIIQMNIAGIEADNDGTIQATIKQNLLLNNNLSGAGGGTGILTSTSGLNNALIDNNKFSGNNQSMNVQATSSSVTVSNNVFDASIGLGFSSSFLLKNNTAVNSPPFASIDLFGGDNGVSIQNNLLQSGQRAILVENPFGVGPNTNTAANTNCIQGNTVAGLEEDPGGHTGNLDATNNWWGSPTGPTIGSNPGGTGDKIIDSDGVVTYKPFLTSRPPGCPPPAKVISIGPSSMQGDLRIPASATPASAAAGFDFTIPGSHPATTMAFSNTQVTLPYRCSQQGPVAGSVVVSMPDHSYAVAANNNNWIPTSDQSSSASYEGSAQIGPVCGAGNTVFLNYSGTFGATFSSMVSSTASPIKFSLRFHYVVPAGKGQPNTNCSVGTNPSSVCGAGWSATKSFDP